MQDEQIQRWRDGDPTAATVVRNGLRGIADAVVSAPTGRDDAPGLTRDSARRRQAAEAVAREVMQRGGSTAADLRALAVMVAARHVVLAVREGNPGPAEDSHLPPQLVVSLSLSPGSLSNHARDVAERHVDDCSACRSEIGLVRQVVKQVTAPRPVAPPDNGAGAVSVPIIAPPPPQTSKAEQAAAEAAEQVRQRQAQSEGVPHGEHDAQPPSPTQPRRPRAPSGPVRVPRGGRLDRPATVGWFQALWPVLAIAAVMAGMYLARARRQAVAGTVPAVAAIADRSVPEAPHPDDLPDRASSAVMDLERGQCGLAADRFRTARRQDPSEPLVAWFEGVSYVCAGRGEAAQAAFDAYLAGGGDSSAELLWYQAQAALLMGRAAEARERLHRLRPLADLERGQAIDDQLRALRTTTD